MTKNNKVDDIENDGQSGLCNKYSFKYKVSYFNHICQRAQHNSLIHCGLMQFILILYPNKVKPPKTKKKVSANKKIVNDRICDITVVKKKDYFTDKAKISKSIYKLYHQIFFFE